MNKSKTRDTNLVNTLTKGSMVSLLLGAGGAAGRNTQGAEADFWLEPDESHCLPSKFSPSACFSVSLLRPLASCIFVPLVTRSMGPDRAAQLAVAQINWVGCTGRPGETDCFTCI